MTLSEEELKAIVQATVEATTKTVLAQLNAQKQQEAQDKIQPKKHVQKVKVQTKEDTAELKPPISLKELRKERTKAKREKELAEKRARIPLQAKCIVCGEVFTPKSPLNKVCSNALCKEVNRCNQIIKKHTEERMKELEQELDK